MSRQLFDSDALHELFDEVAKELQFKRAFGNLYLIGGSALALAYDDSRKTYDVDARIEGDHGKVIDAIRTVAKANGLPSTWINEQATPFMPTHPDVKAREVYRHPNLVVHAASREHLIAMKLMAGRPNDLQDAQLLINKSPKPIDAEQVEALILTLYGPDAVTGQIEDTISTIDFGDPPTIDPPGLSL